MNKTLQTGLAGFLVLSSISIPLSDISRAVADNLEESALHQGLVATGSSLDAISGLLARLYDEPVAQSAFLPDLIEQEAQALGLDPVLARRIAFCESRFRQYRSDGQVIRGLHNAGDVGLFQINERFHLAKSQELGFDIYTTEGNLAYALWLLKNEGPRHWQWSRKCWSR